jgi:DNA-directed RNA polymerase subunit E'/Rpb7
MTEQESTTNTSRRVIPRPTSLYMESIIHHVVYMPITDVAENIKHVIEELSANTLEGKCCVHGFVRPNSCSVISYSSGEVRGSDIKYHVVLKCLICNPPEEFRIRCNVTSITKVGIKAIAIDKYSPLVVFVSRDHMKKGESFDGIAVNQDINVQIVGTRFELNDPNVTAIGLLVAS